MVTMTHDHLVTISMPRRSAVLVSMAVLLAVVGLVVGAFRLGNTEAPAAPAGTTVPAWVSSAAVDKCGEDFVETTNVTSTQDVWSGREVTVYTLPTGVEGHEVTVVATEPLQADGSRTGKALAVDCGF